jgi:hypothetical protein
VCVLPCGRDASAATTRNPGEEMNSRVRHPGMCPCGQMTESIKEVWATNRMKTQGQNSEFMTPEVACPLVPQEK